MYKNASEEERAIMEAARTKAERTKLRRELMKRKRDHERHKTYYT